MAEVGPRFGDEWPSDAAESPSVRWLGLKRAWRTTGHLRACLALFVIVTVIAKEVGRRFGWPQPIEGALTLAAALGAIGLAILVIYLVVLVILGLIQALTGWDLREPDRWLASLPWWGQILAVPFLIAVVSVPTVATVILLMMLSIWTSGLLK